VRPLLELRVQEADFDPGVLQRSLLAGRHEEGAVATFTGYVRAVGEQGVLTALELEHYPGMTENSILAIMEQAASRWSLLAATVIHRVGRLRPGDQIVWVGVAAGHRAAAFDACQFMMDYLKTQAPFWKREQGAAGSMWLEQRQADRDRAGNWSREG
jgi:molybdopterin synthase catalytic subunit